MIYSTMAKFEKRIKAQVLRKKGYSINDIADRLGVSTSSVSLWCRDLILSKEQKEILFKNTVKAGNYGRMLGASKNKEKKEANINFYNKLATREINSLSRRDFLIAGVSLYWAEGSKTDKLSFVNSDSTMVKFMFDWFKEFMSVRDEDFMPRIFINETHRPRIRKVILYWSKLLTLPIVQFGNPILLKGRPKKIYENHDSYYGMLSLRIHRSTNLKYHVLGLISAMKGEVIED